MAEIPQPPTPGKKILDESEPLKAYHGLMGPFLEQLRIAFGALTLKDNHGALVTDPTAITPGAGGALSGVFVAAGFSPLLVFYRAELLDNAKRPTGTFIGGVAEWSTAPRSGEQGFAVTKAVSLSSGAAYSVTFLALQG